MPRIVALIDDDNSVRESLESLIRSAGFAVRTFDSAEQFLNSPYLRKAACLVLDVRMPGMSGTELHRHLLSKDRDVPVIFMTAYAADEEARSQALANGALAYPCGFFYYHLGQPNKQQAIEIRKWFWATGVAQRYSGRGYHQNIVADAKLFESLARGTKKHFVFRDRLDPVLDIQGSEYASRAARTRTFFCLLASRTPRYLENGEPIPIGQSVVSHSNRKHRHHIFPKEQLRTHFSSRVYNSLCNICFLVSRDNEKIGMRLPRHYLSAYREAGRQMFRQVMRSHLIPVGEDNGVWERGVVRAFKQFRKERLALICANFEKEAGIKLFRKN